MTVTGVWVGIVNIGRWVENEIDVRLRRCGGTFNVRNFEGHLDQA